MYKIQNRNHKIKSADYILEVQNTKHKMSKVFIRLRSCNNFQTERSIFEYGNWPRLQIKKTGPSSSSVQLVRPARLSSWYVQLVCLADLQCCNVAKLQRCNVAMLQSCIVAMLQCWNHWKHIFDTNERTDGRRDRWASWAAVAAKKKLTWC